MDKNILIHASQTKIKNLVYVNQGRFKFNSLPYGFKPRGLWYAPGITWLDWCKNKYLLRANMYKYFYEIDLKYTSLDNPNKNRILKIDNKNDFDRFNIKYGFNFKNGFIYEDEYIIQSKYDPKSTVIGIQWKDVGKDFGGIEIIPLLKSRLCHPFLKSKNINADELMEKYRNYGFDIGEYTMFWYSTFDIASGCIWNPKAIENFYRMKSKL